MSGNGVLLTVPIRLRQQTHVTITLTLPVELTKAPLQILCQGRVAARGHTPGRLGMAAIIDDYQFRPAQRPV